MGTSLKKVSSEHSQKTSKTSAVKLYWLSSSLEWNWRGHWTRFIFRRLPNFEIQHGDKEKNIIERNVPGCWTIRAGSVGLHQVRSLFDAVICHRMCDVRAKPSISISFANAGGSLRGYHQCQAWNNKRWFLGVCKLPNTQQHGIGLVREERHGNPQGRWNAAITSDQNARLLRKILAELQPQ